MNGKADIAVIILTYNESIHLARVLSQVKDFARQIVVVDSYSTDDTVEIARAHSVTVLQHPFHNYAKQFQWALENASIDSEWIMRLDADETIDADLSNEIIARLPQLPADVTGIYLNRKTIFQDKFIRYGGRYPLLLLRIWRNGKARIEDRWMDEHMYLLEGRSVRFSNDFADHNLNDIEFFTSKHIKYATREALDVIGRRRNLWQIESAKVLSDESGMQQPRVKRFLKEHLFNRIPFEFAALGYFLYRYIVLLGFLDGRKGLTYHFLQGFWYRFLAGAKVLELEEALVNVSNPDEARETIARLTHHRIV